MKSNAKLIKVTNLKTGAVHFKPKEELTSFLNNNNQDSTEYTLIGCMEKSIHVLNFNTLNHLANFKAHEFYISCMEVISENLIASGSYDYMIKIWDIKTNNCINSFQSNSPIICLKKLKNNRLAAVGTNMIIIILDITTFSPVNTIRDSSIALCLEESQTSELICGTSGKYINIWGISKNENALLKTLNGHTGYVTCLKLLPSNQLVSGSKDNTVKVWDLVTGGLVKTLEGHMNTIMCFEYVIAHEGILISGSVDKKIKLWSLGKGICLKTLEKHADSVNSIELLANNRMVSASFGEVLIWDLNNGECIKKIDLKYQKIFVKSEIK